MVKHILSKRSVIVFALLFTINLFAEKTEVIKEKTAVAEPEVLAEDSPVQKVEKQESAEKITPVQFSFFAPLQIFPELYNVYGLRLTLPYGSNKKVYGLDLGIVNREESLYGVGISAFYTKCSKNMYGFNLSGAFNLSEGDASGLSMAGFFNEVNTINGVQMATLCNQAKRVNGVQIGLFNYCHKMNGVQIGLLNYCRDEPFKYTFLFNFWDSATTDQEKSN
jgi:hypothetical protein